MSDNKIKPNLWSLIIFFCTQNLLTVLITELSAYTETEIQLAIMAYYNVFWDLDLKYKYRCMYWSNIKLAKVGRYS